MKKSRDVAALLFMIASLLPAATLAATLVGRVAGQFGTSPTGGATYTIPIEVASGMNGLKHVIALAYNSQAGDGLAGPGWTLAGFPAITRCGLTRALDGRTQGVRFIADDRFCLDDRPLVLVSGTHGADGAQYRGEIHAYERVFARGRQGNGPAWFEVLMPDGTTYRYGNDPDSRAEAPGTGELRSWFLNEIEDRYHQRIGFSYTEDEISGEHLPAGIHWTYGSGETLAQARYRLVMQWEPRPAAEVRSGFLWGAPWLVSRRLAAVDYEYDDGSGFLRVHRYALGYSQSTGGMRSQVATVSQCGPRDCLPATTMTYDPPPVERSNFTITTIPVDRALFGDVNGDGATDVFGSYQNRWAVWPANPQGGGFTSPVAIGGTFGATTTGALLDFNGDGLTDLLTGSTQGPSWLVYLAPSTSGGAFQVRNTGIPWVTSAEVRPIDVDADALDDLVYLRNGMAYIRRNTGGALGPEQPAGIAPVAAPLSAFNGGFGFVDSADFDGDGRRDLLVARSQPSTSRFRWEVFLSTGTGFARDAIASFDTSPNRWNVLVVDMNGDGLSDLLVYDGGQWRPYVSHGTGGGGLPGLVQANCPAPLTEPAGNKIAAVDMDGDGRSELIIRSRNNLWAVHRSDGTCFDSGDFTTLSSPDSIDYGRIAPIDTDGDGNVDLMFGSLNLNRWTLSRPVLPLRPDGTTPVRRAGLLREVTDGLGNVHEIQYRALTGWNGYGASGSTIAGTRLLRGAPLAVVSEYATSSGVGDGRYRVSVGYSNLRNDLSGRGTLGFESIRTTDSRSGLVTETQYRQDFPYTGRVDRVTVLDGARKVSVHDVSWNDAATAAPDAAADTHFVHLAAETTETYEIDAAGGLQGSLVRSTARALAWNLDHGAVAADQVTVSSPQLPGASWRTTRSSTFDEAARSAGCPGLPVRVDVTREVTGVATQTRSLQYGYDAATCRPTLSVDRSAASPALQLWTLYTYDAKGRTQAVTRTDGASALPPRTTRYAYDGAGFRPSRETQEVNGEPELAILRAWNDGLGVETSRTSAQGQTTAWSHDDIGRLSSELRPTGSTQAIYTACGPCFARDARYALRQVRSDGYWTETQHDRFGRIVGKAFVLADGRASRQSIEYGADGEVSRESMPYIEGDPVFWTSYARDLLGRPRSIDQPVSASAPSGSITSITYSGLSVTVRDPEGRSSVYAHDPEHRITTARPPIGGVSSYGYDAFGQLVSVTDGAGHGRQLAWDERGLLASSTDPDAGRRSFTWNAFGELVTQADGRTPASTMTMQYDQLGRMTSRTEPEGVTTWTYVASAGPSRGLVQQVTSPTDAGGSGFRESFAYDSQGRVQRATTVIDGASYQTDYAYDAEGRITAMTYPETVGWRPRFLFGYGNGHLVSVTQEAPDTRPVYALVEMDAQGRDAVARLGGNAVESRSTRDPASSRLIAIRAGTPADPTGIQNYAFDWDRVGNLLARRDLGPVPAEERFVYDDIDRLLRVTLNGAQTLAVTYGNDGNILSKSDVGNYAYGSGSLGPHAVTSVSGGPRGAMAFAYDANGNMTSRNGSPITWTSFNLPRQMSAGADYSRFTYGPDRARVKQESRTGASTRIIHYVGPHFEVEIQGSTRRFRSTAFAYGHAVFGQVESTAGGLDAYYILQDQQGSVDRLVRAAGTGADRLAVSFDAWGKRRNANWTADPGDQRYADAHWTERGYTGHEHLDNLRLIHMNGRIEDPLLGRMLSPDPVLASLASPQAQNPYSYVANGPVSYTDPSGYFLGRIGNFFKRLAEGIGSFTRRVLNRWGREIAAVVAAYYTAGAASSWTYAAQMPDVAVSLGSASLAADGVGIMATLTATVPSSVIVGGIAGGAVAGAVSSGSARGAGYGALTGGIMAGIGGYYGSYSASRVIAEAAVGGVSSELQGGDFRAGFLTSGALSALTWGSLEMRRVMIEQSRLNPANASGPSAGFRGDEFKLGGCRAPCRSSPLGGVQGRPGSFFGIDYGPNSFLDHLIETYAGPHDFLNSPLFYDQFGNGIGRPALFNVVNAGNVLVATPFAVASVIPGFTYGSFSD